MSKAKKVNPLKNGISFSSIDLRSIYPADIRILCSTSLESRLSSAHLYIRIVGTYVPTRPYLFLSSNRIALVYQSVCRTIDSNTTGPGVTLLLYI